MEQYLRDNKAFFVKQSASFKFPTADATEGKEISTADTTIATRIRPLLPNEIEQGELVGICAGPAHGCAVAHEIRRKLNGQPALNVSSLVTPATS
jgi:hypothetical protein